MAARERKESEIANRPAEDRAFIWLLVAISILFALVLWPFFGAVLWAVVLAMLFAKPHRRLAATMGGRRRNLAALASLLFILLIVILPLVIVGGMLVQEASAFYERMKSGEIDFGRYARQLYEALPSWIAGLLDRFGLGDFSAVQDRLALGARKGAELFAGKALDIGQTTLDFVVGLFVMLYLLYFLLRDGEFLAKRVRESIPLRPEVRDDLLVKLGVVVRATVKGNVVVAILQGALGGLIFWILDIRAPVLWGVLMAILSLLPAIGTALVWGPVAIYFLATGSVTQGLILLAYGVLVIGLVDNVARPMLVGKDTKMPDYVVLISTLGGLAIFGVNGFLIGPLIAAMFIAAWDLFADARARAA